MEMMHFWDEVVTLQRRTHEVLDQVGARLQEVGGVVYTRTQQVNQQVGQQLDALQQNWLVRQISRRFGTNWVLDLVNQVDAQRTQEEVNRLLVQLPGVTPQQISERLIQQKLLYVGGLGLASGLVPVNLPFLALDIVATLRLQVDLVYEIACAYGLDLNEPTRKAEVLWVLALGIGAERTITQGVQVFERVAAPHLTPILLEQLTRRLGMRIAEKLSSRLIPLVGAVLSAGANVTFLYALGRTAINFYEQQRQNERVFTEVMGLKPCPSRAAF
ncbi:EcsC family protein [Anthocerotibacter panamensis]|uniref:EcsC family protein n=1 Tax=Anthocerotibacter panamensis TaxID=2857077 RepID=UPI001C406992|nr:EcsC family protein [Anthocerotibacter panamensis]